MADEALSDPLQYGFDLLIPLDQLLMKCEAEALDIRRCDERPADFLPAPTPKRH
jgi:hypothetical protein